MARIAVILLFLVAATATRSWADSIVLNGSFENGDQNWVHGYVNGWYFEESTAARTGDRLATTGCVSFPLLICTLSQELMTTPGAVYDLSFWLAEQKVHPELGPETTHVVEVRWDGSPVASYLNPVPQTCYGDEFVQFDCSWTQFVITGLTGAVDGTTSLAFLAADAGYLFFDDITVTEHIEAPEVAEVPEPGSVLLLGGGLAAMAVKLRSARAARRRQDTAG